MNFQMWQLQVLLLQLFFFGGVRLIGLAPEDLGPVKVYRLYHFFLSM